MTALELTKPAPTSLVVRRTLDASVDRVFDAWLSPDALRVFLSGASKVLDVTVDPRVGGSYRIKYETPEGEWYVGGVYKEIAKNLRIVCTWTWEEDSPADAHESLLQIEFRSLSPTQTELVLTHTKLRDEKSRDGHANGWSQIVESLATMLQER